MEDLMIRKNAKQKMMRGPKNMVQHQVKNAKQKTTRGPKKKLSTPQSPLAMAMKMK